METRRVFHPGIKMSEPTGLGSAHPGLCLAVELVCPLVDSPGRASGFLCVAEQSRAALKWKEAPLRVLTRLGLTPRQ